MTALTVSWRDELIEKTTTHLIFLLVGRITICTETSCRHYDRVSTGLAGVRHAYGFENVRWGIVHLGRHSVYSFVAQK
jgi:hypothetical protein